MDKLIGIAKKYKLKVVEDFASAAVKIQGKSLGTIGELSALVFTK